MILERRERIAIWLLLIAMASGLFLFNRSIRSKLSVENSVPCDIIVPTPQAILSIDKLSLLNELYPNQPISSISGNIELMSVIIAFYDRSEMFIIPSSSEIASRILKLMEYEFTFKSEQRSYGTITISSFAEANGRFLSCFYHNGLFVASYDLNLIKKSIRKTLTNGSSNSLNELNVMLDMAAKDKGAELFISRDVFDIAIQLDDSSFWRAKESWIEANIYHNVNGDLCGYSELQIEMECDSMFITGLNDSISARISDIFPKRKATVDITKDSTVAYISVCLR